MLVLMLAGTSASADVEIHRCLLDDGTFAFQEKPCPEPAEYANDESEAGESPGGGSTPAANDDAFDFVNPFDEPESPPAEPEATLPDPVSQDRAGCEKMARDAIDAIDLEMRQNAYTKEQGRAYLEELRALTQQLRACKQL